MIVVNRNIYKPFFKQFILLRENIQNCDKILQFKKKKWEKLIQYYKKRLKRYYKYKPIDQNQYIVSEYPYRHFSFKKRYKITLHATNKLRIFYGGFSKKQIKYLIKKTLNQKYKKINQYFIEHFENRLDVILYRSKFSSSIRNARQLILHKNILVNNKYVRIKSYQLKPGDIIAIDFKCSNLIKKNIAQAKVWPIPPKHLVINYRTMQIIFGTFQKTNLSFNFFYHLNLEKILTNYYQH